MPTNNELIEEEISRLKQRIQELEKSVSDHKRSQEECNYTMSLLNVTLESTADGLLVVDREGKILKLNRKYLELWRIPESIIESRDDSQGLAFVLDQLKDPQGFLSKVEELHGQPTAESFDVIEFKDGRGTCFR